jgi:glycosyltransferase involved in cell wall biosynthesis
MKKIIFLGTLPSSLLNFRGELIKSLSVDNKVICMASNATYDEINKICSLGCSYEEAVVKRSGLNPLNDIYYLLQLYKLFKKIKPDLLISYTAKPVIWGGIAARILGIKGHFPIITGLGYAFQANSYIKKVLKLMVKLLYKISLNNATKVIFQNNDNLLLFLKEGLILEKQCALINGSGINLNEFKFSEIKSKKYFLLIARLLGDKGIREFVKAAKIVKKSHPDAIFEILGPEDPSPDRISIKEINQWVKNGYIVYSGSTSDVRAFIDRCSVYVLPSYHEGMPRTVLEAMAMGRPILTTNVPGCRDTVINGKNGWLVKKSDEYELADRMIWFIENPDDAKLMGKNSHEMACDKFDVNKVNKSFEEIIGIDN